MNTSKLFPLLLFLPLFFTTPSSSHSPPRFIKSSTKNHKFQANETEPQQFFEVTRPLLTDAMAPSCTVSVLNHSFANTYGEAPASAEYAPPPETCEWSIAVLEFRAECKGEQYDRIAGVWLDGAELLRTSTAQPTDDGIFWIVQKDVTRYSSIISQPNLTLSVMLENIVNDEFTGVYHVNVTFLFYSIDVVSVVPVESEGYKLNRKLISVQNRDIGDELGLDQRKLVQSHEIRNKLGLDQRKLVQSHEVGNKLGPDHVIYAQNHETWNKLGLDQVISVQNNEIGNKLELDQVLSGQNHEIGNKLGFDEVASSLYPYDTPADLIIPISGAIDDGFWFRIQNENNLHTKDVLISPNTYKAVLELYVSFHGDDEFWYLNPPNSYIETNNMNTGRGNGAYREILVTIDGLLVGTIYPIPVIFTGGINPLFWEPVVSIGAFDLPTYDINLTPFLGLLLDNKNHSIGFQVSDGISFWLIDANLHLWLDHSNVMAITKKYKVPSMEIEREYEFEQMNGEFEIESERSIKAIGWVAYSAGIVKTQITEQISYKSRIKIENDGNRTNLDHRIKRKTKVKITNENFNTVDKFTIERTYPLDIKVQTKPGSDIGTSWFETRVVQERNVKLSGNNYSRVLDQNQNCTGSMVVKGHSVLSGLTENHQSYEFEDESGCYSRKVDVVDGGVIGDETLLICLH